MDNSNRQIITTQNQQGAEWPEHIASLMMRLPNMPKEMQQIAEVKYSGPRFSNIDTLDIPLVTKTLLAQICTITGWLMPENKFAQQALVKEFQCYCMEIADDMTPDEVRYAMRHYALGIKDWGKAVNLQMINEPLIEYRNARAELSEMEGKNDVSNVQQSKLSEPFDWHDTIEKLRSGEISGPFEQMVPYAAIYDWAEKMGLFRLTDAEKWDYMSQARDKYMADVKIKKAALIATVDERQLNERLRVDTWKKDKIALACIQAAAKTLAIKKYIHG